MGRGRLRRGYSLEVIFEEDSDLNSALNSLEPTSSGALHNRKRSAEETSSLSRGRVDDDEEDSYYSPSSSRSTRFNFSPLLSQERSSTSEYYSNLINAHNHNHNHNSGLQGSGSSGSCEFTAYGHRSRGRESNTFASLDGVLQTSDMDSCYIEWDEFSSDSLISKNVEDIEQSRNACANGRRSRVSRRQIVAANWLIDDEDEEDYDRIQTTSTSTYCPPPAPPTNLTTASPPASSNANQELEDIFGDRRGGFTEADAKFFDRDPCDGGGCGSASTSLLLTDETYAAIDTFDEANSTISAATSLSSSNGINLGVSNDKLPEESNRNSNNNGFASSPSSDDTSSSVHRSNCHSVAKMNGINNERTNLNSSVSPASSTSLSGTLREIMHKSSSSMDLDSPITDVKKVRALFENSSSNSETETSSSSPSSSWRKSPPQKKTSTSLFPATSKTSLLSVEDRSGSDMNLSTSSRRSSTTSSPLIRSAYSQLQLNHMEKYEFADLLVNDKIIIEDSPDLFQKQRSRLQDIDRVKGSLPNGHGHRKPNPNSTSTHSSLRRSKSVGAGLHKGDNYDGTDSSSNEDIMKSRPCILAEELPAPDTVKNVRNVFEKLFHKKEPSSDAPIVIISSLSRKSTSIRTNSIENSSKTLSSIKSNPTSKILRSESMRDDSIKNSRYGKPILLSSYSHSPPPLPTPTSTPTQVSKPKLNGNAVNAPKGTGLQNGIHKSLVNGSAKGERSIESQKAQVEVKRENANRQPQKRAFEIGKRTNAFPTVGQRQTKDAQREQDSLLSVGSSLGTINGDDDEPRMISPDVLQKIRSFGTTTTYFGGEIVAKTVKNRNLIVPPPKLDSSVHDPIEIVVAPSEIFFSARPNQDDKSARKSGTPSNNNANRNSSGIDFTSFRFMEFESPSSRLSRLPDDEDIPRIISVEPKSQPNSPTKSNSPVGTVMSSIIAEGRNSPEGCESTVSTSSSYGTAEQTRPESWINNHSNGKPVEDSHSQDSAAPTDAVQILRKKGDGNNNCIKPPAEAEPSPASNGHDSNGEESSTTNKKFSEAAEGAWF